jgi:hypothetical protein
MIGVRQLERTFIYLETFQLKLGGREEEEEEGEEEEEDLFIRESCRKQNARDMQSFVQLEGLEQVRPIRAVGSDSHSAA